MLHPLQPDAETMRDLREELVEAQMAVETGRGAGEDGIDFGAGAAAY